MTYAKASLDPDFLKLKSLLEHWRSSKKGYHIPESLWNEAIRLTHHYGKQQVIRNLGLSSESFKRRIEKNLINQPEHSHGSEIQQPEFVEIPFIPPTTATTATPATVPASVSIQEPCFALRIKSRWGIFKIEVVLC